MTSPPHTLEAETGPDPVASIIVMHGLGADGSDFAPFVDEIDLRPIGPVRWLFPNAPQQPVTINGGYVMPAWFDIRHDRGDEDEAGLRRSQAAIGPCWRTRRHATCRRTASCWAASRKAARWRC